MLRGRVRGVRVDAAGGPPAVPVPPSAGTGVVTQPDASSRRPRHVRGGIDRLAVGGGGSGPPAATSGSGSSPTRAIRRWSGSPSTGTSNTARVGPADRVGEAVRRRVRMGAELPRGQPVRLERHRLETHRLPSRSVRDRGPCLVPDAHDGRPAERARRVVLAPADPEPQRVAGRVGELVHAGDVVAPGQRGGRVLGPDRMRRRPGTRHIGHCAPAAGDREHREGVVLGRGDDARQAVPVRLPAAERRGRHHGSRRRGCDRLRSAGEAPAAGAGPRAGPRPTGRRSPRPRPRARRRAAATGARRRAGRLHDERVLRAGSGARMRLRVAGARGRRGYCRGTGQPSRPMARCARLDATGGGCHLSSRASMVDHLYPCAATYG